MPRNEVERRTMWISVWHSDMFGRNDFLGEVMMPMAGQVFDDPSAKWFSLQDRVSYNFLLKAPTDPLSVYNRSILITFLRNLSKFCYPLHDYVHFANLTILIFHETSLSLSLWESDFFCVKGFF